MGICCRTFRAHVDILRRSLALWRNVVLNVVPGDVHLSPLIESPVVAQFALSAAFVPPKRCFNLKLQVQGVGFLSFVWACGIWRSLGSCQGPSTGYPRLIYPGGQAQDGGMCPTDTADAYLMQGVYLGLAGLWLCGLIMRDITTPLDSICNR